MHYLIIGNGRVAKHFCYYLSLIGAPYSQWKRSQDLDSLVELENKIKISTHILLAISDAAIESFYQTHLNQFPGQIVHFSGTLEISNMTSAHPLMTFNHSLYNLNFYKKIHFVLTSGTLSQCLPGLENTYSIIPVAQKALYHSMCVIGGNFTHLLIQKMLLTLYEMNIPYDAVQLYIEQTIQNLFSNPHLTPSGPLARNDQQTIEKNLQALQNDSYKNIYLSFVKTYQERQHDHF